MLSTTSPGLSLKLVSFASLLLFLYGSFSAVPLHAQVSPGPYRLIGTIKGKDVAGAVLDDSAGNQIFYRLREKLPDGSRITRIQDDVVSVQREDGTSYDLYIVHDAKPSAKPSSLPAPTPAKHAESPPFTSISPAPLQAQEATSVDGGRPGAGYQGYSGDLPGVISEETPSKEQDFDRRSKNRRRSAGRHRSEAEE